MGFEYGNYGCNHEYCYYYLGMGLISLVLVFIVSGYCFIGLMI